jgi:hypothetical protein
MVPEHGDFHPPLHHYKHAKQLAAERGLCIGKLKESDRSTPSLTDGAGALLVSDISLTAGEDEVSCVVGTAGSLCWDIS